MTVGCGAHAGLAAELRAVAVLALDRLGPALDRMSSGDPGRSARVCEACPVCALVAVLRGERPELAGRLAEYAAGLLAVLQEALHESDPTTHPPSPDAPADAPQERRVQHIPVERPASRRPA